MEEEEEEEEKTTQDCAMYTTKYPTPLLARYADGAATRQMNKKRNGTTSVVSYKYPDMTMTMTAPLACTSTLARQILFPKCLYPPLLHYAQ